MRPITRKTPSARTAKKKIGILHLWSEVCRSWTRASVMGLTGPCEAIFPSLLLQGSHVDHEAVLHVALQDAIVSLVDLLDRDDFDVGNDIVLPAEIEHLLRFGDAADERS